MIWSLCTEFLCHEYIDIFSSSIQLNYGVKYLIESDVKKCTHAYD